MDIRGNWKHHDSGRRVDRGTVECLSRRIAGRLSASGPVGRTLAFAGLPIEQASAVVNGAWWAGWAVAPLRADAPGPIHQAMCRQLGEGLVVSAAADATLDSVVASPSGQRSFAEWLGDATDEPPEARDWSPAQAAVVLFTSGSSGQPKGVVHSQCNMLRAARLFARQFELVAGETLACLAPPHTASGLRSLVLPLVEPVDVAVWPREAVDLAATFDALERLDPQVVLCGPRFVAILAAAGRRVRQMLPSLRLVVCTGAPVGERDRDLAMRELGVDVLDFYGLSETGGIVLAERLGAARPGVLPPACEGVTVHLDALADRAGVFELRIEGPNVFLGYLDEPRFRRQAFATGDLVRRQADGSLVLVGRRDRAFKSDNTEWVYPERLQAWLCTQPHVRDAHVETLPDEAGGGPRLTATVEMDEGVDLPDLSAWARRISCELGKEYSGVRLMPGVVRRNALGKIQRN